MADSILNVKHGKFEYVFVPCNVADEIQVRTFEGTEEQFQQLMKRHFGQSEFTQAAKSELTKTLRAEGEKAGGGDKVNKLDFEGLADQAAGTYQIIPLTMPTKTTNYEGINAYIDNVGRVKDLETNARASRITSDDIRGDCFISKTFDDEETFRRISFTRAEYDEMLANPPPKSGRWSMDRALTVGQAQKALETDKDRLNKCANCFKTRDQVPKLLKCGKCLSTVYCSAECQKQDWTFHKRVCK